VNVLSRSEGISGWLNGILRAGPIWSAEAESNDGPVSLKYCKVLYRNSRVEELIGAEATDERGGSDGSDGSDGSGLWSEGAVDAVGTRNTTAQYRYGCAGRIGRMMDDGWWMNEWTDGGMGR
jgi:hypothetical protein